jgi:hypothetical protein
MPDGLFDTIYTDPVWPNNTIAEFADVNPYELFAAAAAHFPRLAKRVLVHLGCDSDPRILSGLVGMPFFKVAQLRYARPHYKGRMLYDRDLLYCFGEPPRAKPGRHIIPGDFCNVDAGESRYGHPCPRRLSHVRWVIAKHAEGPVLDPFAGSCTTAEACVEQAIPYCCIERSVEYCEGGNRRLQAQRVGGIQLAADIYGGAKTSAQQGQPEMPCQEEMEL